MEDNSSDFIGNVINSCFQHDDPYMRTIVSNFLVNHYTDKYKFILNRLLHDVDNDVIISAIYVVGINNIYDFDLNYE